MSKLSQEELDKELLNACHLGYNVEVVKCLVEVGADVNARNKWEGTPLHHTSSYEHLEIVKYLVEVGADVNAKDKWGHTPLKWAIIKGHLEVVNYLKSKGGIL